MPASSEIPFANYLQTLRPEHMASCGMIAFDVFRPYQAGAERGVGIKATWVNYLQSLAEAPLADGIRPLVAHKEIAHLALEANQFAVNLLFASPGANRFNEAHEVGQAYLSRKQVRRTLDEALDIFRADGATIETGRPDVVIIAKIEALLFELTAIVRVRVRSLVTID